MRKPAPLLLALAPLLLLTGCSTLAHLNARRPGSRAFITPLRCEQEGTRVRLAVKDNIDLQGVVTTAGSQHFARTRRAAEKDAPCLAIARERNVQIVGKTNLSEFAVAPSGLNEYYGTPRNPYCFWKRRIPGGSSSGSAVAVAGGMADIAFGTDTAGSIRVPAACCGIVGLKTTHGLIPVDGIVPIEPQHLDTVGPMGRDITSTVVGMDLLQRGFLAQYAAAKAARPSAKTIRVGRLRLEGTDPKIDAAIDAALARSGFQVVPLEESFTAKWEQAKRDGNAVAAAGAWLSGKQYQFTPGVALRTKVVILSGRVSYNTKYQAALARRGAWQAALQEAFRKVDFIALPTLQRAPFYVPPNIDAGLLEAKVLQAQNTVPVNFAGNPALAFPVRLGGSLFSVTSLQLIGPPRGEAKLLNAGRLLEKALYPMRRGSSVTRLAESCPYTADAIAMVEH